MYRFLQQHYIYDVESSKRLVYFLFFSSGEKARDTPYEVNVSIPIEGYEPIQFILTKMCGKLTFLS
jgi:hypothetical protein